MRGYRLATLTDPSLLKSPRKVREETCFPKSGFTCDDYSEEVLFGCLLIILNSNLFFFSSKLLRTTNSFTVYEDFLVLYLLVSLVFQLCLQYGNVIYIFEIIVQ